MRQLAAAPASMPRQRSPMRKLGAGRYCNGAGMEREFRLRFPAGTGERKKTLARLGQIRGDAKQQSSISKKPPECITFTPR